MRGHDDRRSASAHQIAHGGQINARHDQADDGRSARARLFDPACRTSTSAIPSCSAPTAFWPYFDRLRKEDPVHYCAKTRCSARTGRSPSTTTSWTSRPTTRSSRPTRKLGGITIRDAPVDLRRPMFIAMDQPQHSRAAQDRGADVHADASRRACDQHPQALRRVPRQPAAQRDLRLGRQGLDRADDADAGRAVRLPVGGSAQADALVGYRDDRCPGRTAWSRPRRNARPS